MRPPDFSGAGAWKAWRVRLAPKGKREKRDHDAGLGSWLLFCPGAHLCWSYWWITLIHLRPIEGVRPAVVTMPGAGWEMACWAQDPDAAPDPDDVRTSKPLSPIDWVVQFGSVQSDEKAVAVAEAVVRAIMRGDVSPDSDFRSFWNKAIPDTAACIATGKHLPS